MAFTYTASDFVQIFNNRVPINISLIQVGPVTPHFSARRPSRILNQNSKISLSFSTYRTVNVLTQSNRNFGGREIASQILMVVKIVEVLCNIWRRLDMMLSFRDPSLQWDVEREDNENSCPHCAVVNIQMYKHLCIVLFYP